MNHNYPPRNSAEHLIHIRRQQRKAQTQQLKNTLRFNQEVNSYIDQLDDPNFHPQIPSQEMLEQQIDHGDFEAVFQTIVNSLPYVQETIETNIQIITEWSRARLASPKAALALSQLLKHSPLAVGVVFEQGRFPEITAQIRRLRNGAKEQNIYLSCVCDALERKQLVQEEQLALLWTTVEEIFIEHAKQNRQHNLIIKIIAKMLSFASNNAHFSKEFVADYLDYFWKCQKQANRIEILNASIEAVNRKPYQYCLTIIISYLRLMIRGREMLPAEASSIIDSTPLLLMRVFSFYNLKKERMEQFGVIRVDNKPLQITLHQFLLFYESSIFGNTRLDNAYLRFLLQFQQNASISELIEVWSKQGLMQRLIKKLNSMPFDDCLIGLKVCRSLLLGRDESAYKYSVSPQAGEKFKLYEGMQTMQQLLETISNPSIRQLCLQLYSLFTKYESDGRYIC